MTCKVMVDVPKTDIKTGRMYWVKERCGGKVSANGCCWFHQNEYRQQSEMADALITALNKKEK